jgi:hypothetical protein
MTRDLLVAQLLAGWPRLARRFRAASGSELSVGST